MIPEAWTRRSTWIIDRLAWVSCSSGLADPAVRDSGTFCRPPHPARNDEDRPCGLNVQREVHRNSTEDGRQNMPESGNKRFRGDSIGWISQSGGSYLSVRTGRSSPLLSLRGALSHRLGTGFNLLGLGCTVGVAEHLCVLLERLGEAHRVGSSRSLFEDRDRLFAARFRPRRSCPAQQAWAIFAQHRATCGWLAPSVDS